MTWSETFLDVFKKYDVRFISYVPDNVLTPLIKGVTSDNYFISVNANREDYRQAGDRDRQQHRHRGGGEGRRPCQQPLGARRQAFRRAHLTSV